MSIRPRGLHIYHAKRRTSAIQTHSPVITPPLLMPPSLRCQELWRHRPRVFPDWQIGHGAQEEAACATTAIPMRFIKCLASVEQAPLQSSWIGCSALNRAIRARGPVAAPQVAERPAPRRKSQPSRCSALRTRDGATQGKGREDFSAAQEARQEGGWRWRWSGLALLSESSLPAYW